MALAFRCAALLWLGACAAKPPQAPQPLPKITVAPAPLERAQQPLPALIEGRVTVVDLWATWCEPCVAALPKLNRLTRAFGPRGLVVVGISVGEEPKLVQGFKAERTIEYPIYVDPDFRFADSMATRKVPTLLIFDKQGELKRMTSKLDEDTLALIEALLGG